MTTSTATPAAIDPGALATALGEALPGVLTAVPGATAIGTPRPVGRPSELPDLGPGCQAVVSDLGPAVPGTLTLAITAQLAAALSDGPFGPQALADALAPVCADLVRALGAALGPSLQAGPPQAVDGQAAINAAAAPRRGITVAGAELRGDGGPVAVVVLTTGTEMAEEYVVPEIDPATAAAATPSAPTAAGALGFSGTVASLDLLADVEMAVTAELGRSRMTVRHLLGLSVGSVVELDRSADSAVDLFVNGTLIARGEVVIIDEEFGVRVTEIVQRGGNR